MLWEMFSVMDGKFVLMSWSFPLFLWLAAYICSYAVWQEFVWDMTLCVSWSKELLSIWPCKITCNLGLLKTRYSIWLALHNAVFACLTFGPYSQKFIYYVRLELYF